MIATGFEVSLMQSIIARRQHRILAAASILFATILCCVSLLFAQESPSLDAPVPVGSQPKHAGDASAGESPYDVNATTSGNSSRPRGPNFFLLDPEFNVGVFGSLSLDTIASNRRLIAPSSYVYLSPYFGNRQGTFELSGRATSLGFNFTGPRIGEFQSGGLILLYAFGQEYFANYYGITIFQGYGELRNEDWRFAFGLMSDVVNPLIPTSLNWSLGGAAGNLGFIRGQARSERYWSDGEFSQLTLQTAISQAVVTEYAVPTAAERLSFGEPDGLPNFEGRVALALGEVDTLLGAPQPPRPFEIGFSGMIGRIRTITTDFLNPTDRVSAISSMVGTDVRVQFSPQAGFKGEFFYGQSLGGYLAGAFQSVNVDTFRPIRTIGGFGEAYYYWTDTLHSHAGYGIDDPLDRDVSGSQRVRNQFVFGNAIYDVSRNLQLGLEVSHWRTAYRNPALGDNQGWVIHSRVQLRF